MQSGRANQLTKQIGEYLVAAELARRGHLVATFSGNVPDFDIVAVNSSKRHLVQVKAIKRGNWQFSADDFLEVRFDGDRQVLGATHESPISDLICVFVNLLGTGKDEFYIFSWDELAAMVSKHYRWYIERKGGIRPKAPRSLHTKISVGDLSDFRDNWKVFEA